MSIQRQLKKGFQQFYQRAGFRFRRTGRSRYLSLFSGRNGKWAVFCVIDSSVFILASVLPVTVPVEKRQAVLEYLNRANWEMTVGNWAMDLNTGEVRYRTSVDVPDGQLTSALIEALLFRNLRTCDHYLRGVLLLLYADLPPLDALRALTAPPARKPGAAADETDEDDLPELLEDVEFDRWPAGDD